MKDLFVYGTLRHLPLLETVLGHTPDARAAILPGNAVYWAQDHDFPLVVEEASAQAHGLLLAGLSDEDMARLDYYEGPFGYTTQHRQVFVDGKPREARVYVPDPGLWLPGAAWSLDDWAARWGAVIVATARDVMALYPAPLAMSRRAPMLVRGASRVRAAGPVPNRVRRSTDADDVQVVARRVPYGKFFAIEEYDLRFRRFDGAQSPLVMRAAFVSGDAVTVLPYDPIRDRVLLVEQFRVGPFARGDAQPWQLEPIAGRIDPDEGPEDAARREAVEEAGLMLGALLPIASYYPTPGAKTEYMYSYLALTDLPDGTAIVSGAQDEAEDIKGHLIGFDDLAALVATGEAATAPLLLSYYWLDRERARLRAEACTDA